MALVCSLCNYYIEQVGQVFCMTDQLIFTLDRYLRIVHPPPMHHHIPLYEIHPAVWEYYLPSYPILLRHPPPHDPPSHHLLWHSRTDCSRLICHGFGLGNIIHQFVLSSNHVHSFVWNQYASISLHCCFHINTNKFL